VHTSEFMACIRTCSPDGGISHQRTAYPRGRRASIPCLKEMPRAEPPLRRSRHNQKMESLRRAMQPVVISKKGEEDENIGASWIQFVRPDLIDGSDGMYGPSKARRIHIREYLKTRIRNASCAYKNTHKVAVVMRPIRTGVGRMSVMWLLLDGN
jgi:hypothetical protein